jgi:hypothetical protein
VSHRQKQETKGSVITDYSAKLSKVSNPVPSPDAPHQTTRLNSSAPDRPT